MKITNMQVIERDRNTANLADLKTDAVVDVFLAGNGVFRLEEDGFGYCLKKLYDLEQAPEYGELQENVQFHKDGRFPIIPKEALLHVIQWYRQVTFQCRQEAQVNFYRATREKEIWL